MIIAQERFNEFSQTHTPSLALNAAFKWGSMLISLLSVFFLTPFVIEHIGKYGYGIWALLTSMLGYYGLLNLGITSAVSRYVALNLGQKDLVSLNTTFNTALLTFIVTGTLAVLAASLVGDSLAKAFSVKDIDQFAVLVQIMAVAVAVSFPTSVLISIVIAHECYQVQSIIAIVSTLVKAGTTVYFLQSGYGLEGVAYSFLITAAFECVAYLLYVVIAFPWIRFRPLDSKFSMLKVMISFGLPTMIMSVAGLLRTKLDTIVIGAIMDMEKVAVYSVAALIISHIFSLANSGLGVITPRFARLIGAGKDPKPLFSSGMFFASVIAAAACIGIFLFGNHFIQLWVGNTFNEGSMIMWILMACYATTIAQIPGYTLLMALNRHKVFAIITLCEGLANVILSITLAKYFGLLGVALGTAIPMLFIKLILQPYFVCKAADITFTHYLKPLLIPMFFGSTGVVAIFYFKLADYVDQLSWIQFLVSGAITMIVFIGIIIGITRLLRPELLKLNV